jgi:hypothetical protein
MNIAAGRALTIRPARRRNLFAQVVEELGARIVRGELVTSLTRRALFYHQVDIQPAWASEMVRTVKIGNHIFYRPPSHATQVRLMGQPVHGALSKSRSA